MKYDELTNALRIFESHIKDGEVSAPLKYLLTKAADAIEGLTDRNVGKWIPVTERLPNEDEITYDGISRKGERGHSDRVLAVNKEGFIRTGYFVGSCMKHPNTSKTFEFGEHYKNDPNEWIVGSSWEPIAWMPLPEPPKDGE